MRTIRFRMWGFFCILALSTAFAQNVSDLNAPLPADPKVRIGRLENGLVYYLRQNAKPENRVMMQLAVNAGSTCEKDDQVGLAHFCEHMMFNGTQNFPKNELISFLQSTGVRFGGDINAYTSFDETVYMLEIPTDKPGLLEKGYQVLEDWAHQATLDNAAIDDERGVIIEEWRMGLGADDRLRKKTLPAMLNHPLYAKRLPIGTLENLKTFKHESLRRFYRDYYRPNLQAVVVVGDIKLDEAEAQIRQHFGSIANPENAPERTFVSLPDHAEPIIVVATDPEATNNTLVVLFKQPYKPTLTVGDYRRELVLSLMSEMFNERLTELTQEASSPFIYAGYGHSPLVRKTSADELYALAKEGQTAEALKRLLEAGRRIDRYGFLESELQRAKDNLISGLENAAAEADKTPSNQLSSLYVSHFLYQTPITDAQYDYHLAQALLPGITAAEVTAAAQESITEQNVVITLTAPQKDSIGVGTTVGADTTAAVSTTATVVTPIPVPVPTEAELRRIYQAVKADTTLQPYEDHFRYEPLTDLPLRPASGAVVVGTDPHGITQVKLSNGLILHLKPTDFQNDEILFGAYSLGGTSLVELSDLPAASLSGLILSQSGLGTFSHTEIEKKLKGHTVSYSAGLSELRATISGASSSKDLETLLQLNYLTFTAPRKDDRACQSEISKLKTQFKLLKGSPNYVFLDSLTRVASNHNPRSRMMMTEAELNQVKSDKVYRLFRDQFSGADGFHFYMVGNFSINDTLLSLLETYMGTLPVQEGGERKWRNVSSPVFTTTTDFEVLMGSDAQSMVGLVFDLPFTWDLPTRQGLAYFSDLMEIKLLEKIREEMGGVYSPDVQIQIERYPQSKAVFTVMFGCDPERTDEITQAVLDQIKLLIKDGPSEEDLMKVKETRKRAYEKAIESNDFWLTMMMQADYIGLDLRSLNKDFKFAEIDGVKAKTIQKTLKKFFKPDVYVRGVLKPVAVR